MADAKPHRFRRIAFAVLRTVVFIYIGVLMLLFFFQSRLVFAPAREISVTPADAGLPYEDVSFAADDGTALSGWFVPASSPRAVVLHCHGNAGNISDRLDILSVLHAMNLDVFIFDYRGYGTSQGKPTENGVYQDAQAAWNYLTEVRHIPPERIVIHGHSLGGPIAAHLARDHAPAALVLESTFPSLTDVASHYYPWLPVRWLLRFRFDTLQYLSIHSYPLLVIHSPQDEVVPFALGRRLFEYADQPKEFLEITGGHNDGFDVSGRTYTEGWSRLLDQCVPRTPQGE